MPVSRALSSPDISHSVGLRGTWVSHVCSLSRFLGSKEAHPQGLLLTVDKARDTSSGQHSHYHLGCTCWWGKVQIPGLCLAVTPA